MKIEKVFINGESYYHYQHCENIADLCGRCCFLKKDGSGRHCELPFACDPESYYIPYYERPIEIGGAKIFVDVPPPPEPDKTDNDPDDKEAARVNNVNVFMSDKDFMSTVKLDKPLGQGSAAKRSSFPNGVKAEDICRYLSFNLGNVVKYACRVGRMDDFRKGYKKIEDLEKAKDYLDNEIKRLKEEFGNEIMGLKEKIAKQKKGDD